LNKNLLLSAAIALSWTGSQAQDFWREEKETVLAYINTILDSAEQSTSHWPNYKLEWNYGRLSYSYESMQLWWCREFNRSNRSLEVSAHLCFETDMESHALNYTITWNDTFNIYVWAGLVMYSDNVFSAWVSISSPLIGDYMLEVSESVWKVAYDPFISFWLEKRYWLWDNAYLIWSFDGFYALYSHSLDAQISAWYSLWEINTFWSLWTNTFGFHGDDVRADTLNAFLEQTWEYIELWAEYCPTDKLCIDTWVHHTLSGPWKWNTNTYFWVEYSF